MYVHINAYTFCNWIFSHLVATSRINISISSSEKLSNVQNYFLYLKSPVNVE